MPTASITGTNSGLGHALAEVLNHWGWAVCDCSRRDCDLPGVHDRRCELTDAPERIVAVLTRLRDSPSGSFVDIREILDPAAYARLYPSAAQAQPR